MRYYVFDLDNTLVFTDALNNEAYNFILKKFGLSEIQNVERITREVVFQKYPEVEKWKDEIIVLKQKFFWITWRELSRQENFLLNWRILRNVGIFFGRVLKKLELLLSLNIIKLLKNLGILCSVKKWM